MERRIRKHREGFPHGETRIAGRDALGFDFSIRKLRAGERIEERSADESAWVLMSGEASVSFGGGAHAVRRASLFDEPPTTLSLGPGTALSIESLGESEWAVARTNNERSFEPRLFLPEQVQNELRGKGLAQNACTRTVRLVFDLDVHSASKLVVGEVINLPGRWSSYPPHHHPQPELYHYRFTAPQGYGHAELGEQVFKVRSYDTLTIMGGETHAQVAAPGYGMYYLWIIRHFDGQPYRGFTFTPEHEWLLDPDQQGWRPKDGDA